MDRSLRHSIYDGMAYSVMTRATESYVSAFALWLRATTAQVGLLATLPPLLASFAQPSRRGSDAAPDIANRSSCSARWCRRRRWCR